jgi:hypothetical protein
MCFGAIEVILQALGELTDSTQPTYIPSGSYTRSLAWMRQGKSTFPPYAINAPHGTIISGSYRTTPFCGFRAPLFPIELLVSYQHQVDRNLPFHIANIRDRLAELMALDSWLSYCGRQPEISGGNIHPGVGDLNQTMSTLVQRTMDSFSLEFENLEHTAVDGGLAIVEQTAGNLLDTLGWRVEGLSPPEKLFALVAMLRAAKMALCVTQGTDTSDLKDILSKDVQVYPV